MVPRVPNGSAQKGDWHPHTELMQIAGGPSKHGKRSRDGRVARELEGILPLPLVGATETQEATVLGMEQELLWVMASRSQLRWSPTRRLRLKNCHLGSLGDERHYHSPTGIFL